MIVLQDYTLSLQHKPGAHPGLGHYSSWGACVSMGACVSIRRVWHLQL